jgi:putative membrane protein
MRIIALLLVAFVALSHVGFLILEMFYWNEPVGREIFDTTPEFTASTAVLAANQGLYNGFLAAGLLWGLFSGRRDLKIFFLCCIIVAGVYGGLTAKMSILYIQGVPALAALLAVLSTRPPRTRSRL